MKRFLLFLTCWVTLFSVSAYSVKENDEFELVTNFSDLNFNDTYILCYETNVMGTPYSTNKYMTRIANGISLKNNIATVTKEGSSSINAFKLVQGTSDNYFAFNIGSDETPSYLGCTGNANNSMTVSNSVIADCNVTFSFNNDNSVKIPFVNYATTTNTNQFQYNTQSGSERFANYKTSGQKDCKIYKLIIKTTPDPVQYEFDKNIPQTMTVGETYTIKMGDLVPANFKIISEEDAIATITDAEPYIITANAPGTANFLATWDANENFTANDGYEFSITVVATREDLPLFAYSSSTATWDLAEEASNSELPTLTSNPAGLTITYDSSDTKVASVSEIGVVTPLSTGQTTITATFAGNETYNSATASYTLTVTDSTPEPEEYTETLTVKTFTNDGGNNYKNYSYTSDDTGITYNAFMATNGGNSFQFRSSSSDSGIITSDNPKGLVLKSVSVKVYPDNKNTADFYGKKTNYTSPNNLYATTGNTEQGTKIGSLNTNGTVNNNDGYTAFGLRSYSGALYLSEITLVWEKLSEGEIIVSKPAISCENNILTITSDNTEAIIYYTTDGTEPSSSSYKYDQPFSIDKTTTVNAIAVVGEVQSDVATYTAVYIESYDSYKAFMETEPATDTQFIINGDITLIYQSGQYLYGVDSQDSPMLIYGNQSGTYTNGDVINTLAGTYKLYNNLPEITDAVLGEITSTTSAIEPSEIGLADISSDIINKYVEVKDVKVTVSNSNISMSDGTNTVTIYDRFGIMNDFEYDRNYDITGFVAIFNGTLQIYPTEFVEVLEADQVATPVFNPKGGAVTKGKTVEITTDTEEATIYYTTDGTEPTTGSKVYSEPIAIENDVTIKAMAAKEDMKNSYVSEASFTVIDLTATEVTFNFTDPSSLTTDPDINYQGDNTGNYSLNGVTLSESVIQMVVTCPSGTTASSTPQLYYGSGSNAGYAFRFYNNSEITISAIDGCYITSIEFEGTNLNKDITFSDSGTLEGSGSNWTWTCNDNIGVQNMTFKKTATGNTPVVSTMTVYYTYYDPDEIYLVGTMTQDKSNNPSYLFSKGEDGTYTLEVASITTNDEFVIQKGATIYSINTAADRDMTERTEYTLAADSSNKMGFSSSMLNVTFTLITDADTEAPLTLSFTGTEDNTIDNLVVTVGNDKTEQSGTVDNSEGAKYNITLYKEEGAALVFIYSPDNKVVYYAIESSESTEQKSVKAKAGENLTYYKANYNETYGAYTVALQTGTQGTLYLTYGDNKEDAIQMDPVTYSFIVIPSTPTGVEGIEAEEAEAEYYDLNGFRVNADNLSKGIYIVKKGNTVTKVMR